MTAQLMHYRILQMKREEVKNLEEEFGHLFTNSQQEKRLEDEQASIPTEFNLVTFKQVPYIETESDEDFLDQVDQVLGHEQGGQGEPSRRQVMLNFKINELAVACKSLKFANTKLIQRIRQLEQQKPSQSNIQSSISLQGSKSDLTMIQQDFVELQQELASYKAQLSQYQKKMASQMAEKQRQIQELRFEITDVQNLRVRIQQLDQQLLEKEGIIALVERRNEELLLELQSSQEGEEWDNDWDWDRRDTFHEKISSEMEVMIDKLLRELKLQKKNSSRQMEEIKRLNNELIEQQNILKLKNKRIYELQFSLLKASKNQQQKREKVEYSRQKLKMGLKKDESQQSYRLHKEDLVSYVPQNEQNPYFLIPRKPEQDRVRNYIKQHPQNGLSYDKNRMSAERQNPGKANVPVPPAPNRGSQSSRSPPMGIKLYSDVRECVLRDLLNKQFKIRQAEKQIIACRIIDLYSIKIIQQNYENLIPQELEIFNFNPQQLSQIRVRINLLMNKDDREETSEEKLLYNMAFILDNLLNQVQVVDGYIENALDLNIMDYISQLEGKSSKEEKYQFLQELANNIEAFTLSR